MNKETKKFNKIIKARRKREMRVRRMKSGYIRPDKTKTPAVEMKKIKLSWWRRLINWLWRKEK